MASGSTTQHTTARFLAPDLIVRGQSNTLSCPLTLAGAQVTPSSGTVSVYSRDGTAVVDGASVSISGDASHTFTPASTLQLEEGWRVEWSLVVLGETRIFRNDAALVLRELHPVLADDDLYRRVRALDPDSSSPISSLTTYQDYRDEAWAVIQLRLISLGNRPQLIMSPSALREPHLTLTLAMVFEDFSTSLSETYSLRAAEYRALYEAEWGRLRFSYDSDEDGRADSSGRRSAVPSIWLTSRRGR